MCVYFKVPPPPAPKSGGGDATIATATATTAKKKEKGEGDKVEGAKEEVKEGEVKKEKEEEEEEEEKKKKEEEENGEDSKVVTSIKEAVRDAVVKSLKTFVGTPDFNVVLPPYLAANPTHRPLLLVILTHAEKIAKGKSKETKDDDTTTIVAAIDSWRVVLTHVQAVLGQVNSDAIARSLGMNLDKDDSVAVAARKDIDMQKTSLITALVAQAKALLELLHLNSMLRAGEKSDGEKGEKGESGNQEAQLKTTLEVVFKELQRWDDLAAEKHWLLYVRRQKLAGRWGLALKRVSDLLAASVDNKEKENVAREDLIDERDICVAALEWGHVGVYLSKWTRFLKKDCYEPF